MMYRCSVCKSTNCVAIDNGKPFENKTLIPVELKCNCFNCKTITELEYFPETKIRPIREHNPFNNLPENFTYE